jgi:hypothetical protein
MQGRPLADEKNENDIYWTFGNPIALTKQYKGISLYNNKAKIAERKIYVSFQEKNIETVKLFQTKAEALEYSRFLRTKPDVDSGIDVYQRAIFKVKYLGDNPPVWVEKNLIINPGMLAQSYDFKERTTPVKFFEVDREKVKPLEASLVVQGAQAGDFKSYGSFTYTENIEYELGRTQSRGCAIS